MTSCVVKWCKRTNYYGKSKKVTGISFHQFPKNEHIREKWIEAVRLERRDDKWLPSNYSRVCSIHFAREDMYVSLEGNCMLHKTAVPICTMIRKIYYEEEPADQHSLLVSQAMELQNETVLEERNELHLCTIKQEKDDTIQDSDPSASTSQIDNVPAQNLPSWVPEPKEEYHIYIKEEIKEEDATSIQETEQNVESISTPTLPTLIRMPTQFPQPMPMKKEVNATMVTELFNSSSARVGAYSMVYLPNLITVPSPGSQATPCVANPQNACNQETGTLEGASTSADVGNVFTHKLSSLTSNLPQPPMEEEASTSHKRPYTTPADIPILPAKTPENSEPTFSDDPYEKNRLLKRIEILNWHLGEKKKKIQGLQGKLRVYKKKHEGTDLILRELDRKSLLAAEQRKALKSYGFLKSINKYLMKTSKKTTRVSDDDDDDNDDDDND